MLGLGLGVNRGGFVPSLPLLDTYTGAAAAYSLRKLRTDYTGAAIRVRESATNTEADIGFNADGTLNTTALLAHVGANNGFVTTWYDQSGNARNATQSTLLNQPQIISSGSVILENSKPTLKFDGVDDHLKLSPFTSFADITAFGVTKTAAYTNLNQNSNMFGQWVASGTRKWIAFVEDLDDTFNGNSVEGSLSEIYANGSTPLGNEFNVQFLSYIRVSALNVATNAQLLIGGISAVDGSSFDTFGRFNGNQQEIIIYGSNQSANRTAIESNINAYYNIY